jgi:hypothetical protein
MMKKFFVFSFTLFVILSACNSGSKQQANQPKADITLLTVLTFDREAPNYVDSAIFIKGTVYHTCKHGGKRLFLVDGTDSIRVEVTTGPDILKFDESLVGSRIEVLGHVREFRVDEKYLSDWENELKNPQGAEATGVHTGAAGHEDQGIKDKMDQINAYRDELKKTGKDHLSFYSVEAVSFREL